MSDVGNDGICRGRRPSAGGPAGSGLSFLTGSGHKVGLVAPARRLVLGLRADMGPGWGNLSMAWFWAVNAGSER